MQAQNDYTILLPKEHADIMLGYQKTAIDSLAQSVFLNTNAKPSLVSLRQFATKVAAEETV